MKVSMELEDGRSFEAVANPKTFNGLASKSAFKKQFNVPPLVTALWSQVLVEDADAEPDEDGDRPRKLDLSQVPAEQLQYLDEQHLAFLVWLELKRRRDDVPDGPWEQLVEQIVDVAVDVSDDDAAEDGTGPT